MSPWSTPEGAGRKGTLGRIRLPTGGVPSGPVSLGGAVRTLTQDAIRALAGFDGDAAPVVSLYLDVDGRRHVRPRDYEMHLDQLLRQARERQHPC